MILLKNNKKELVWSVTFGKQKIKKFIDLDLIIKTLNSNSGIISINLSSDIKNINILQNK